MNAGANGAETKDVLVEATGIDRKGNIHTFSNADMKFVYRNSRRRSLHHLHLGAIPGKARRA